MHNFFKDLGLDDQTHYWFISGDQTSTIEWEAALIEEVQEEALKKAVLDAMQIHTHFRSHPVIVGGRVKVSIDDEVKQVPVFAEDGRPRQFGTSQTNGYLFYAAFQGDKLYLRLFHGLSDGRGSLSFLTTLLLCYVKETKQIQIDLPEPDSSDDIPVTEQILKEYAGSKAIGRFDADDHMEDVFRLSVDRFKEKDRKWRVFEIDVPLASLLAVSSRNESSVVPVLETIIGNAIRRKYDVGDKLIIGYTPVDMRQIFGLKTGGNGSTAVSVPYPPVMDKFDLGKRFMLMRSILDLQIQPENIYAGQKNLTEIYNKVCSQPYPIEIIVPAVKKNRPRAGAMTPYTYGISYPGKVRFQEPVEPIVNSVVSSVSAASFPLMIVASEYNWTIRIMVTQLFDSDETAKVIFNEIANLIPGTAFIDRGIKNYDRLDLELLEHMD